MVDYVNGVLKVCSVQHSCLVAVSYTHLDVYKRQISFFVLLEEYKSDILTYYDQVKNILLSKRWKKWNTKEKKSMFLCKKRTVKGACVHVGVCVCVHAWVCVREREREFKWDVYKRQRKAMSRKLSKTSASSITSVNKYRS